MRINWVGGWAVPCEWLYAVATRVFPGADHVVVPAAPDWRERLDAAGRADALGAYSLGTFLALREREWVASRYARVGLLAPIWAFAAESGRGGRVARAQVRALRRNIKSNTGETLAGFYRDAGLSAVAGGVEPIETLDWGLAYLERECAAPGFPTEWWAGVGENDALLDSTALSETEPRVNVIEAADHSLEPLMRAWAREARR